MQARHSGRHAYALRQANQLYAPVQPIKVVQEPVRICSDAQHPLSHGLANDWVPTALAQAINDLQKQPPGVSGVLARFLVRCNRAARRKHGSARLLIGKHGPERGTPVDSNLSLPCSAMRVSPRQLSPRAHARRSPDTPTHAQRGAGKSTATRGRLSTGADGFVLNRKGTCLCPAIIR